MQVKNIRNQYPMKIISYSKNSEMRAQEIIKEIVIFLVQKLIQKYSSSGPALQLPW